MDKLIAIILATLAGGVSGFLVSSFFPETFGNLISQSIGGGLAGGVIGAIVATMTGSDLNKQSDVAGVRLFLGIGFGAVAGILAATRFEIVREIMYHIERL